MAAVSQYFASMADTLLHPNSFKWVQDETPMSHIMWPAVGVITYLSVVFGLQAYMNTRKDKIQLETVGRAHNLFLSIWSGIMALGALSEVLRFMVVDGYSFNDVVCDNVNGVKGGMLLGRLGYWAWMYYCSKYYELLDTVLQVFRKRPLTVLHVYHHCVIIWATWSWNRGAWTLHWCTIVINCTVHLFMYYYYYVASYGQRPWWRIYITKGQLTQFSIAFFFFYYWCWLALKDASFSASYPFIEADDNACAGELYAPVGAQIMNISFLFLFGNFYVQQYIKGRQHKKDRPAKEEGKKTQ